MFKKLSNFKSSRCSKAVCKVSAKQFLTATRSRSAAVRHKEVSRRACAKHRARPEYREKQRAIRRARKLKLPLGSGKNVSGSAKPAKLGASLD